MTDSDISGVEQTTLSAIDSIKQIAEENSRIIVVGSLGLFALNWIGIISLGLPSWWPVVAAVVVSGLVAGWAASDRLYSLIPEDTKITLVAFETGEGEGGEIWQLHPDDFEEMDIEGDLYEWSESPERCYEVRSYNPETNSAVGNWRETPPASDFAKQEDIESVRADIRTFRESLEPEVRRSKRLRRQLSGVVRSLDAQRDREMSRHFESKTVDQSVDGATITEVLESVLDDDLRDPPDAGRGETDSDDDADNIAEVGGTNSWIEQDEYDAILNGGYNGKQ